MSVIHYNVTHIRRNPVTISFGGSIAFHFGWMEERWLTSCEKTFKFNNTTELSDKLKILKTYFYGFWFDSEPLILIKIIY